jgi:hypothetical protein
MVLAAGPDGEAKVGHGTGDGLTLTDTTGDGDGLTLILTPGFAVLLPVQKASRSSNASTMAAVRAVVSRRRFRPSYGVLGAAYSVMRSPPDSLACDGRSVGTGFHRGFHRALTAIQCSALQSPVRYAQYQHPVRS